MRVIREPRCVEYSDRTATSAGLFSRSRPSRTLTAPRAVRSASPRPRGCFHGEAWAAWPRSCVLKLSTTSASSGLQCCLREGSQPVRRRRAVQRGSSRATSRPTSARPRAARGHARRTTLNLILLDIRNRVIWLQPMIIRRSLRPIHACRPG